MGGHKFGFIRSISQSDALVNTAKQKTSGKASRELDAIDYIDEQAEQEGRGRADAKPMSDPEKAAHNISIKCCCSKCKQYVNIPKFYLQTSKTMV